MARLPPPCIGVRVRACRVVVLFGRSPADQRGVRRTPGQRRTAGRTERRGMPAACRGRRRHARLSSFAQQQQCGEATHTKVKLGSRAIYVAICNVAISRSQRAHAPVGVECRLCRIQSVCILHHPRQRLRTLLQNRNKRGRIFNI